MIEQLFKGVDEHYRDLREFASNHRGHIRVLVKRLNPERFQQVWDQQTIFLSDPVECKFLGTSYENPDEDLLLAAAYRDVELRAGRRQ